MGTSDFWSLPILNEFPHMKEIFILKEKISTLKQWQIIKKIKLKRKLRKLRYYGAMIGFNYAIDILVECGMLKPIKIK